VPQRAGAGEASPGKAFREEYLSKADMVLHEVYRIRNSVGGAICTPWMTMITRHWMDRRCENRDC
jgi:hypothetical protein